MPCLGGAAGFAASNRLAVGRQSKGSQPRETRRSGSLPVAEEPPKGEDDPGSSAHTDAAAPGLLVTPQEREEGNTRTSGAFAPAPTSDKAGLPDGTGVGLASPTLFCRGKSRAVSSPLSQEHHTCSFSQTEDSLTQGSKRASVPRRVVSRGKSPLPRRWARRLGEISGKCKTLPQPFNEKLYNWRVGGRAEWGMITLPNVGVNIILEDQLETS